MDNIWIFLVIIGAIFSFAQKNQSKRQGSDAPTEENNGEESATPHEMMERRLREMLGEESSKRVPTPIVVPITQPAKAKAVSKSVHTAVLQQKPMTTLNTKTSQHTASITKKESQNSPKSKIIEEFTMEKAVVYSEILKPKFEEF